MNLSISDIHGRTDWKKFINTNYTHIYFLGDYFDSHNNIKSVNQINNFKEICDLARKDKRVHLGIGNHDLQYLKGLDNENYLGCSGAQFYARFDIQEVLEANMDIINPVYLYHDILISHAGITNTYMKNLSITDPLAINALFKQNRNLLGYTGYDPEGYGNNKENSCLWIRPQALLSDKLTGYKQIVGHTHQEHITTINDITFTDTELREVYEFE